MKYLLLIFSLVLCFCSSESPDDGFYFDEKKFMSEWNSWKNQDVKSYSFTLKGELPSWLYTKDIHMDGYEVKIIVKNSIMKSFEYIGRVPYQEGNSELILEPEYTSISDMYQKIYESIKDCERYWKETSDKGCFVSTRYEIKYDPEFHYITSFKPITRVAPGCILDTSEHEVTASEFSITQSAE
jgi:hypothetical protein